jgi:hypothetical protein
MLLIICGSTLNDGKHLDKKAHKYIANIYKSEVNFSVRPMEL